METEFDRATEPEKVLLIIEDLISNFLYYDRKEDEDFPVGRIEELVEGGGLTIDQMVDKFRTSLRAGLGHH